MSRQASATRSPVSHASGVVPSWARKRRWSVAGDTAACVARSATVSGSPIRACAQASSGASDSSRYLGHGAFDELPLPAVAMGGEDEPPGHGVRDLGAVVAAHDVQPEVERGRAARRGQHVTVVHEEHVRLQEDLRVELPEEVGPAPVGGGPAPVQDPGLGEREAARCTGSRRGRRARGRAGRRRVRRSPRGTTLSGRPGTTSVSASSTASSPGTPLSVKKPWFIRIPGVGVHSVSSYSGSGRPEFGARQSEQLGRARRLRRGWCPRRRSRRRGAAGARDVAASWIREAGRSRSLRGSLRHVRFLALVRAGRHAAR